MGLLDEAIRDHLELKRRRGADPAEVEREEHEALEPVFPVEPSLDGDAAADVGVEQHEAAHPDEPVEEAPNADLQTLPPAAEAAHPQDFSAVSQETAELDMQAYLDAEAQASEADGSSSAVAEQQIPGQERLSFE